jgi:hypothetical protein
MYLNHRWAVLVFVHAAGAAEPKVAFREYTMLQDQLPHVPQPQVWRLHTSVSSPVRQLLSHFIVVFACFRLL